MTLTEFQTELLDNLNENILPYWMNEMVDPNGGFYGRRDGEDRLEADAPKGAILNARILWSFAASYRMTGNTAYIDMASRAKDYILDHFIDREHGGAYWSLNADGTPLDTKKQFYAIAFIIYGLAEYFRATGDNVAIQEALELFKVIEKHSRDREKGGYIEAATCDWQPIADMRLSEHDANSSKTMNTHLHIIEGYTNLLRSLKECDSMAFPAELIAQVTEATTYLLRIFLDRIENQRTHHLTLFFDDDWNKLDDAESYGHDIEASWLLLETAQVIGDEMLIKETLSHTYHIARAGLQGRCWDGSMVYERHPDGHYDNDKHWWVQAENVIGQLYLARFHAAEAAPESDGTSFRDREIANAYQSWRYIADNLVDPKGEWHWSRRADGSVNLTDDKAGFWKCPYHNSRMCLEGISILRELQHGM
ncbi:MAG: AGE family epimerase/isomerase [Duncaniella sp.]|nr:AGE family epimerase/isomerase [Duncaniella sp.]